LHLSEKIGARLQEERKRLGLNQEQIADSLGVSKRTQAAYEAGTSDPSSTYMNKAQDLLAMDVCYVVTGVRTPHPIEERSAKEEHLVQHYRLLPTGDQDAVDRIVEAMAAQQKK